jgi:tRNA-splicing ligase RtcB
MIKKIIHGKEVCFYADDVEEGALKQLYAVMEQDAVIRGAVMPDVHQGYSLPIGAVVKVEGNISPAYVGYDIGCGMAAVKLDIDKNLIIPHAEEIVHSIRRAIPTGFHHNKIETEWDYKNLPRSEMLEKLFRKKSGLKQLGTLGSGNHFIEIGHDPENRVWIIIHSGSRNVGWQTAAWYMLRAAGNDRFLKPDFSNVNRLLRQSEGQYFLRADSQIGRDYIADMDFCLKFALANRFEMIRRIVEQIDHYAGCGKNFVESSAINRNHNHAEFRDGAWIHRKGATHAEQGMAGVIPGNMRDGSFIVKGKGNSDALWSSAHGAGRKMSRHKAKKTIPLEHFRKEMEGITSSACKGTLDEAPDAYKSIFRIMEQQKELVEVVAYIKPIINIKDTGKR